MPRKGPAYPISPKWRQLVRLAIDELIGDESRDDITSDVTFAKSAGIAKSTLSEALDDKSTQSAVMPQINAALGWPAPRLLCTPDELELMSAAEALDEREIGRILGKAESKLAQLRSRKPRS